MIGRYASYWNAFLLAVCIHVTSYSILFTSWSVLLVRRVNDVLNSKTSTIYIHSKTFS